MSRETFPAQFLSLEAAREPPAMRRPQPLFASLASLVTLVTLVSASALLGACAASKESTVDTCNVGADCASGVCTAQGVCVPVADAAADTQAGNDAADTGAPEASADARPDATTTDAPPGDTPTTGCTPNGDYVITAQELPLGPGLKATYRVAASVTIDTTGTAQADGTRNWDFSGALAGDKNVLLETSSPTGAWWASSYPTATYAVPLSSTSDLLGVFKLDAVSLSLLGIVSPTNVATTKTNVSYGTPVPVTKLPLQMGSAWTVTNVNVTGTYQGTAGYTYYETYDIRVDAKGHLTTPFGVFPVLRVSTLLSKTIGLYTTKTRTYGYMAECFGTVASAVSTTPTTGTDPGAEFTSASELRRLAP
jgi:hypothetical protein